MEIILNVKRAMKEDMGMDYRQVFKNYEGLKIFVIDQLTKDEIKSRDYSPKDNFTTVLFVKEY